MQPFSVFLLGTLLSSSALAGKMIVVEHAGYNSDNDIVARYRDIFSVDFLKEISLDADARCRAGTITLSRENGDDRDRDYGDDVCELFDDLIDFLEDEDELIFRMKWEPVS
jgi:hypothetical protein